MDAMLPNNTTKCCSHLAQLREYAAAGLKEIMAFAEDMNTYTDTLPDDLKPYGEAMTNIIMEALMKNYVECFQLRHELGLQKIAWEASKPEHQTESDLIEKE
jgi:hypothetical protein